VRTGKEEGRELPSNMALYQSKGTIFYDDVSDHFPILLEVANK